MAEGARLVRLFSNKARKRGKPTELANAAQFVLQFSQERKKKGIPIPSSAAGPALRRVRPAVRYHPVRGCHAVRGLL